MPTKLKNLKIKKVDFVDEGANPKADIKLLKNKDGIKQSQNDDIVENPKFWKRFMSVVTKAFKLENEQPESEADADSIAKGGAESFNDKFSEVRNRKICDEIWEICYALQSALCSIMIDDELDGADTEKAMHESLNDFADVVKDAIGDWLNGKTANILKKETEVTASDLLMMKSAKARLEKEIEKSETAQNIKVEGEKEMMNIDKSKLTEAERAFLESIEKKYGAEYAPSQTQAQVTPATSEIPADNPVEKSTGVPAQEQTSSDDDIYKGLNPLVKEEIKALKKFKEEAEERELGEIAKKYEVIGKKKEELVPMFKSLRAAGGTAYNDMIAVLDATVEAVNKSGVFSEIGKSGNGYSSVGNAEGKINSIAKSYMEKEPTLGYTEALAKAWENNPDLMNEYDSEEGF